MKALFPVVIVVLLGCMFAGCFPVAPMPDNNIHVFLFAGFRRVEVEYNIAKETSLAVLYDATVLRYEITNRQHIIDLAELYYFHWINWQVPEVAYAYHVIVDAPPTDAVLYGFVEWAEGVTEVSGSVVTVLADSDVLRMIQRVSFSLPVVMSVKELRSRDCPQ